jgi:hypothetical protein
MKMRDNYNIYSFGSSLLASVVLLINVAHATDANDALLWLMLLF